MIIIMRNRQLTAPSRSTDPGQTTRARRKANSRRSIIAAASGLFRRDGIAATSVADVMSAAGLTHGAFYSHFADKNALVEAAFTHGAQQRNQWFSGLDDSAPRDWLARVTKRYLNKRHRDHPEDGCPFPALCREMAGLPEDRRLVVDRAIEDAVRRMAPHMPADGSDAGATGEQAAMALLSLFVGATVLSRAVASDDLADALLDAGRQYVLGEGEPEKNPQNNRETP